MRRFSFRRTLQTIHLWLGLILGLPFIIIGVTGSVLLVQRESVVLTIPSVTASGPRQPIERIVEAAKPAAPEGSRLGRIEFREGAPVIVQFATGGRPQQTFAIYVDPVSLAVLGGPDPVARSPFMRSIQELHEYLWLPSITGLKVVGWMGVAMTFMGLSGLFLWWPRGTGWRHAFLMPRGAKGLRFHLDLHHVAGFWGSAFLLILSISGIYLTFAESFSAVARAVLPSAVGKPFLVDGFVQPKGPLDADGAIRIADSAVLDAKAVAIQLPDRPGRPVVVYMDSQGFGPTTPPILVTLDPDSGELGYVDDPRAYSIRDQFLNWQYALHFALGLPLVWKTIVFVSGLLPLALAITGTSIWWLRRRVTRRAAANAAASETEPLAAPAE